MTILLQPVISEKSLHHATTGMVTFVVEKDTTKNLIKKAVEELFKVHVRRVTTCIRKGKKRFVGKGRKLVVRRDRKIARVQLLKGETIDYFTTGETK